MDTETAEETEVEDQAWAWREMKENICHQLRRKQQRNQPNQVQRTFLLYKQVLD